MQSQGVMALTFKVYAAIGVDVDFIDLEKRGVNSSSSSQSFETYHVLQFGVGGVLAERLHDFTKFLGCDRACRVKGSVSGS